MFVIFSYTWQLGTFVFHKGVNSIRADESSLLVPMKCLNKQNEILQFLVTNGNSTLVFYLGVNSIRADNLSSLVLRILNKKNMPTSFRTVFVSVFLHGSKFN